MKKYTTLVYLKVILEQVWQLGLLKMCFMVVPCRVKIQFWISQPPRIPLKRFEMHQGCVFSDPELDGAIYFGLSAEMTKIQAIFHLCRWFETTPEGGKSPITPLYLQIDRNKWYHSIRRNEIHSPDVFKIISRIKVVLRRPKPVF